jgi:hypothetical protein
MPHQHQVQKKEHQHPLTALLLVLLMLLELLNTFPCILIWAILLLPGSDPCSPGSKLHLGI